MYLNTSTPPHNNIITNQTSMKISFLKPILLAAFAIFSLSACSDDENNTTPQSKPTYDMTGFAKGADVSWLSEMEKAGSKFYNASGAEQDCMTLLRDLGVNSIRLRVWVDPQDGWSGKQDVLAKAWRAKNLGQRIMIDFHYSDSWADPGKQNIPTAWTDFKDDLQKMKAAVAEHTTDVLSFLKENGIDVEWIQIGNETTRVCCGRWAWRLTTTSPTMPHLTTPATTLQRLCTPMRSASYTSTRAICSVASHGCSTA